MQTAIRYQQCVTSYKYRGVPIIITFKNKKMRKTSQERRLTRTDLAIFKQSRNNYGTRKIKKELEKQGLMVSRRRIGRMMKELRSSFKLHVAYYSLKRNIVTKPKSQCIKS